jgi:superfamily II DNA or RNA helicase/HKD family nuclease
MDLFNPIQTAISESPAQATELTPPHLVLNDKMKGLRVLSTIQAELQKCESFRFYVAFANQAGVASLLQALDDVRHAGICGKVLVSQYLNFTSPQALRTLMRFDNIDLRIATQGSVHAKGFFFFRQHVHNYIVGSSNWTHSALSLNTELNLKIQTTPESPIAREVKAEFDRQFVQSEQVDNDFIDRYEGEYQAYQQHLLQSSSHPRQPILQERPTHPYAVKQEDAIRPNRMQKEALANLDRIRQQGKNKALIVSATGTGKTFLSAFDAQVLGARKLLFAVHRENIARAALDAYQLIFGSSRTFGVYSGNARETSADFVFSTVQTLSRSERMRIFTPNHFDYIIVDESHRTGAASYARFLDYFQPNFLLGMTATPERTDGVDIFQHFNHNVAYEIRLQQALEEEMLCPFHYFGVRDLSVQGELVGDTAGFSRLIAGERVERIIEKASFYGCDDGIVRGLVFCSRVDEAVELSKGFNERGFRTLALSGSNNEFERETAIKRLESDDPDQQLDYIFTVDIFNEGVDIPRVNQIIMLRPTQSAIIFVQQLGRGLRKIDRDKYLTVIDFIGNYQNNYLIPIALYGDRTFDKDQIRRLVVTGNQSIPGTSTINFDRISKEKIFASLNSARLHLKKDLRADFTDLSHRLGRIPMMMDFFKHGNRDPRLYVKSARSYYNFVHEEKPDTIRPISDKAQKLLEVYSKDVLNGKRLVLLC